MIVSLRYIMMVSLRYIMMVRVFHFLDFFSDHLYN